MSNSTIFREPSLEDLPQLLEMGRAFHAEGWYGNLKYDEQRVVQFFRCKLTDRSSHYCCVAVRDRQIVGAIAGTKLSHWFSDDAAVFDSFIYVIPALRGTLIGYRLWRKLRGWAEDSGARELTHGVGTGLNVDSSHRFFTGLGMTHVGGIYKLIL